MSSPRFTVSEHVIPASHIREYPRGARSPSAALRLKLSVKRYTPIGAPPLSNAITIVATHANGLPRETYEPLWDLLLGDLPKGTIRAIWFAECTHQGSSSVLNDGLLGDDPSYYDHGRDLFVMINHFAAEMPQPIFGIGHSMGSAMLLHLSRNHPRLMHSLALIEPVVQDDAPGGPNAALGGSKRPDWWPTRAAAEETFRKNRFFQGWNELAFQKYLEYGLRSTPTPVYPNEDLKGGVTLVTSKAQETWSYNRGNFAPIGDDVSERWRTPDLDEVRIQHTFHRPEIVEMNRDLPRVRPNVMWIFGERSPINIRPLNNYKLKRTGTGLGGSGGAVAGNVEAVTIQGAVHMLPQEKPHECASILAPWLVAQHKKYIEQEKWYESLDRGVSDQNMTVLSKQFLEKVKKKEDTPRPVKGKL